MDLFDAIAKRHSYRGPFAATRITREDLQKIVQAGIDAPSAKNEQVTSFVIVDDPQLLRELAAIISRPVCETAAAMIVCVTDPRPILGEHSFAMEDCAASAENMLLAITALGYATVWIGGMFRDDASCGAAGRVSRLLGVPAGKIVRVILPVGVPVEQDAPKEKLPFVQRAWFNRHGG
jgi:nitroreductase